MCVLISKRVSVCAIVTLLVAAGCSGRSDLGLVSGTVTLDGKPLPNAFVEFSPQAEGSVASGRTDENGEYFLMYSRTVKGASVGENVVRITTHDVLDDGGKEVHVPEKVPARYNANSELVVTVKAGSNELDFELESAGGKVVQPKSIEGL
ncbi:MAG: carboxypeptidase regulatory-like domain-containing protein [Planctomycetales bacterium]|nr:carboxypeptidase regulatory-like domain-containing protein [Planctomycetales bacterium]MCA9192734.1 carboxypeptidase regulatory-like domain-containing protein [Planctomycetales bacterium]